SGPLAVVGQSLPTSFGTWSPENRAAYLALTTLLPSYLLSSQGDRMAMAHVSSLVSHSSLIVSSSLRVTAVVEQASRTARKGNPPSLGLAFHAERRRGSSEAAVPIPGCRVVLPSSQPEYVRAMLSPESIR